jgi:hypothetical protein
MEIKEERLSDELVKSNIPLVLNGYTDIFSDFDPRPFTERALSDDFLLECKHAAREKEEGLELILAIPKNKRSLNDESKIKKRLKEHFKKHHIEEERRINSIKKEGWIWVGVGTVLMLIATAFQTYTRGFLLNLLTIIMEPASWFSFWEGLGKIFIHSTENRIEAEFYHKMASAEIIFKSY